MKKNKKIQNLYNFLKTYQGFVVITIIAYVFVAILIGLLIWSAVKTDQLLYKYFLIEEELYPRKELFLYGSILGVSAFLIVIININVWVYWSYSRGNIPELKDKLLFNKWLISQKQKKEEKKEL